MDPKGSPGTHHLPRASPLLFTDKVSQEVDSCQKVQLASALPVVLAVSCFFLGLGIGTVCVLRKTQVSVNPQISPVSL